MGTREADVTLPPLMLSPVRSLADETLRDRFVRHKADF
jgi:hypothetical protein